MAFLRLLAAIVAVACATPAMAQRQDATGLTERFRRLETVVIHPRPGIPDSTGPSVVSFLESNATGCIRWKDLRWPEQGLHGEPVKLYISNGCMAEITVGVCSNHFNDPWTPCISGRATNTFNLLPNQVKEPAFAWDGDTVTIGACVIPSGSYTGIRKAKPEDFTCLENVRDSTRRAEGGAGESREKPTERSVATSSGESRQRGEPAERSSPRKPFGRSCEQMAADPSYQERIINLQFEICKEIIDHYKTSLDRAKEKAGRGMCYTSDLVLSTQMSSITLDRRCVGRIGKTGRLNDAEYACLQESSDKNIAAYEDSIRETRVSMREYGCRPNSTGLAVDVFAQKRR